MRASDLPNAISLFRIILVGPIVWFMATREFGLAFALFFIAGLSDGIDGYLAKRYHWESRLGSIIDPLADKILLIASFIVLAWLELIPVWLMAIVILRDVVIVIGGIVYHYSIERFEMKPSMLSKLNTLLQIVFVILVVFSVGLYPIDPWFVHFMVAVVASITVMSGIQYILVWSKRAHRSSTADMHH